MRFVYALALVLALAFVGPASSTPIMSPAAEWSPAVNPSPAATVTDAMAPTTSYSDYNYVALGFGPAGR